MEQLGEWRVALAAETQFDVLITTDRQLRYQQNLTTRKIAVLVLPSANWRKLRLKAVEIATAVDSLANGGYVEFE